jgi:M-phase inducer tyrosine phosphatase
MSENVVVDVPSFEDYTKQYRRISGDTFCAIHDSHPAFKSVVTVDCRTKREYKGGHIKGAIRVHPFLDNFGLLYPRVYDPETLFVFHCEFSAYRAPAAIKQFYAQHARARRDKRDLHAFVLDGGFSRFWQEHPTYCVGTYIAESEQPI